VTALYNPSSNSVFTKNGLTLTRAIGGVWTLSITDAECSSTCSTNARMIIGRIDGATALYADKPFGTISAITN